MQLDIPRGHRRSAFALSANLIRVLFAFVALTFGLTHSSRVWAAWPDVGVSVSQDTGNQTLVGMVPDGHGGSFALWANISVQDLDPHPLLFAQHISPGGAPTWGKDGLAVATTQNFQFESVMISDARGGVIVALSDRPSLQTGPSQVILQRLSVSGKREWGESGVTVSTGGARALAADGSGGAIVVFGVAGPQLLAQHVGPDGSLLWDKQGVPLANWTGPGFQGLPLVVGDGSGGAVVAWTDFHLSPLSISGGAQRLAGDGTQLWSQDGVILSRAPQALTSDGSGAFLIASFRVSGDQGGQGVLLQKLDGNGAEIWTPGGISASQSTAVMSGLLIASDAGGGAFLSWLQTPADPSQSSVMAQHVDGSGTPLWGSDGVPAAPPGNVGFSHPMGPDGAGGLFVTSQPRLDDGGLDLVFEHLDPHGTATAPATTLAHAVDDDVFGSADHHGNAFFGWTAFQRSPFVEPARSFLARLSDQSSRQGALLKPSLAVAPARAIAAIAPNPSRGSFHASGVLPGSVPTRVELIDLRGRVVASRLVVPAGGAWSASFEEAEHLASGTYVLRIIQGNVISTGKVSVIR